MTQPEPRRYLLCRSSGNPRDINILWMDRHGSCPQYHADSHGNLYPARFHMIREKGIVWGLLCPNGLESDEWSRVGVDDPPGSWVQAYVDFKNLAPVRRVSDLTEVA